MEPVAFWPLLVYFVAAVILAAVILTLSYFLGPRHRNPATGTPYESGIIAAGSARMRFDVRFYLLAMFFVLVDLEAVFVFAWAIALRAIGWAGYVEIAIFIGVLLAGLLYLARGGALDWETPREARAGRHEPRGRREP